MLGSTSRWLDTVIDQKHIQIPIPIIVKKRSLRGIMGQIKPILRCGLPKNRYVIFVVPLIYVQFVPSIVQIIIIARFADINIQ